MFKIDWVAAVGGGVIGYLAKGKVEDTKDSFKRIYTGAINSIKESFSESDEAQAAEVTLQRMDQKIQQKGH